MYFKIKLYRIAISFASLVTLNVLRTTTVLPRTTFSLSSASLEWPALLGSLNQTSTTAMGNPYLSRVRLGMNDMREDALVGRMFLEQSIVLLLLQSHPLTVCVPVARRKSVSKRLLRLALTTALLTIKMGFSLRTII